MVQAGFEHELLRLLSARGWSEWEFSRAADVKLDLVGAALSGSGAVPVEALRRLAHVLDAELTLRPVPRKPRSAGPVESVVDKALRVLEERHVAAGAISGGDKKWPDDFDAFIREQRSLIDRLEGFAATPGFNQLQRTLAELGLNDGATAWLCQMLIQPAFGLGEMPLDVVRRPGGLEVVDAYVRRLVLNPMGAL